MERETKASARRRIIEYQLEFRRHHSLPETERWKNGANLKLLKAKALMAMEDLKNGY